MFKIIEEIRSAKTDEKVAGRSQRSIVMRFVKGKLHQ